VSEGVSNELEVHYEERELLADLPFHIKDLPFQINGGIIISYKKLIGSVNLPPQYSIHFEFEFNGGVPVGTTEWYEYSWPGVFKISPFGDDESNLPILLVNPLADLASNSLGVQLSLFYDNMGTNGINYVEPNRVSAGTSKGIVIYVDHVAGKMRFFVAGAEVQNGATIPTDTGIGHANVWACGQHNAFPNCVNGNLRGLSIVSEAPSPYP
jgi:hypothetical protein